MLTRCQKGNLQTPDILIALSGGGTFLREMMTMAAVLKYEVIANRCMFT